MNQSDRYFVTGLAMIACAVGGEVLGVPFLLNATAAVASGTAFAFAVIPEGDSE